MKRARPRLRRLARSRRSLLAVAVVVAALAAASATIAASSAGDQPPPGAKGLPPGTVHDTQPTPRQPPAGAPAVPSVAVEEVPAQPANLHPKPAGPSTNVRGTERRTGVDGNNEPPGR